MLGRALAALGLLFVVAGCTTDPTPPHRHPMVDNPGANGLQRHSDPATSQSIDQQIEKKLRLRPVVDGRPRSIIGVLAVTLQPDGSVLDIKDANHAPNLDNDPDYKHLVQSYEDAIRAASPIAVTRDKFSSWQTFTMKISRHIDPGKDAVRAHIERYWTLPASVARRTDDFFAVVEISIDRNGNVLVAKEVHRPADADSDPDYPELLESCLKAIRSASPLPFPKDRYAAFENFKIRFNPRFMTKKTFY